MIMFNEEQKIRARVILADDHPEVVEGLRALVESEFDVVGTVGDGNALIAAVEMLAPDVVVTDIAMPGLNGMTAAARILSRGCTTRSRSSTARRQSSMSL